MEYAGQQDIGEQDTGPVNILMDQGQFLKGEYSPSPFHKGLRLGEGIERDLT
jgi:hypothetical protein